MKKLSFLGGIGDFNAGARYEWDATSPSPGPVVDIIGTSNGWAKETYGPVVIRGNDRQTMVRISGLGGWKIVGSETIS